MPQPRRAGAIRVSQPLPPCLTDLTLDNINLCAEMSTLSLQGSQVGARYEDIIRDLEQIIANLQERNRCVCVDRDRLMLENLQLREQLEQLKNTWAVSDSHLLRRPALFDVVQDEDSIHLQPPRPHKYSNEILEQSEFDLHTHSHQHHFSGEVSAQMSMSAGQTSLQRTPCLNNNHTVIQCRLNNNQAPLRVFYLLLLQEQGFIDKIRELLNFYSHDESKVLLPLLPKNNEMWAQILEKFLDLIIKGQFEDEKELIAYISENILMDMLLISVLKQSLPVENEDEDLNVGDWKNQVIDHRILFQGLCNEFDLTFEQDREEKMYRFYLNTQQDRSIKEPEQKSEENLLDSRSDEHPVEISLLPKTKAAFSGLQSRQEPIFRIWVDAEGQFYRTNISIRPHNFNPDELNAEQTSSFKVTERSLSEDPQQSEEEGVEQLREVDMNRKPAKRAYKQSEYLRPQWESYQISRGDSHMGSENSQF